MPQAESRSRTTTTEKKMVEGVRKARKVQAAAQRTAHVKTRRLIASTEDLECLKLGWQETIVQGNEHALHISCETTDRARSQPATIATVANAQTLNP